MNNDKKLRCALVGCGGIAGNHIFPIRKSGTAEIVALCDIIKE